MSNIPNLTIQLGRAPTGEEIAGILIDLLKGEEQEAGLLVLAKLKEALRELRLTMSVPEPSTEAGRIVRELVLASESLLTADDVVRIAPAYPRSLRHRSGASAVLNTLVSRGELGKVNLGRETHFTSAKEAVRQAQIAWMRNHPDKGPERTDPAAISAMTGLSSAQIIQVLREFVAGEP